jgi:hypothetical protein
VIGLQLQEKTKRLVLAINKIYEYKRSNLNGFNEAVNKGKKSIDIRLKGIPNLRSTNLINKRRGKSYCKKISGIGNARCKAIYNSKARRF